MPPPPPVDHLDFEPRAADFLDLLRDLGHLDPAAVDRLTAQLLTTQRADHVVRLDEVRRAAAVILFESEASMRPEQRELLHAEWGRLFA